MITYFKQILIVIISCSINFTVMTGCQDNNPISAEQSNYEMISKNSINYIDAPNHHSIIKNIPDNTLSQILSETFYPQDSWCLVRFFKTWDNYRGSSCLIPNGSFLEFQHGALTPPSNIPWGEEVTITMTVEMDTLKRELVYTFGPSGCTFDPPAKLWIDWSDLGSDSATLFYIKNDGSRELQLPDQIDVYNKHMCIYINHFSRYAVAYSNLVKPKDNVYIVR